MEKGDYLEVHFEESEDLQSPIFIPAELISKLRTKRQNMYIDCSVSYDPELFSKKNIRNTFKYIFENVEHIYTGYGDFFREYYSKLPPSSKNYACIQPKHYDCIPHFGKLEENNENGNINFSFNDISFGILNNINVLDAFGVSTDKLFVDTHTTVTLDETKIKRKDLEKNSVSTISELKLKPNKWRDRIEQK